MSRFLLLLILIALPGVAAADKRTVCTITVNSSDEKEAFRRYLAMRPGDHASPILHRDAARRDQVAQLLVQDLRRGAR